MLLSEIISVWISKNVTANDMLSDDSCLAFIPTDLAVSNCN